MAYKEREQTSLKYSIIVRTFGGRRDFRGARDATHIILAACRIFSGKDFVQRLIGKTILSLS